MFIFVNYIFEYSVDALKMYIVDMAILFIVFGHIVRHHVLFYQVKHLPPETLQV